MHGHGLACECSRKASTLSVQLQDGVMQGMPASKTSFQLVNIPRGDDHPPGTLLRMCQVSGSISLVMRQVQAVLCPHVTLDQFRLTASKQRHAAIKTLEGPDCLWVFKYGATGSHSHKVSVISLPVAIGACRDQHVHPAVLSSLESLREPGKYQILETPEHILKLNCTPDVNPTSLLVPLPLPSTLPESPVSAPTPRQRYALPQLKPHLANAVVISQQLTELKTWVTTPIQLNRKGPPLQEVSWQNLLCNIWLFLGFCWKWMRIQQPCLQHYLSPHLVASFMSFHIAMKHCSSTIKQHVATSVKVLAWWSTKPGGHDKGLQQMRQQWLPNLSAQIGRALPSPTKSASTLPSAKTLLSVIHTQRQSVLAAMHQGGMSAKLARSLHDLTLASTVFGYLPPIRISCIRALMLPTYVGSCLKPDCILGATCHGNQLQHISNGPLHMHLPHHKNEGSWGRAPISFNLPQDLAELMRLHLSQGHKLLTEYLGREEEPHVFVDNKGRPFNDSNLTIYWDKMLASMGLTPSISPSLCRQVFVSERRSAERVGGPSDRGAAMVMGHSLAQWTKWYDLDFHAREAQQAVDAMSTWRHNLLSPQASASPSTPLQPLPQPELQQQATANQPSPTESQDAIADHVCTDEGGDDDDDDHDFFIDIEA